MEELLAQVRDILVTNGPRILLGIAILPVGWFLARIARAVARRSMRMAGLDPTLTGFGANLLYVTLLVFVGITALGALGIPTASFAVVVGAAGLSIGLALKGTLTNLAAGVMLILLRPFKVGDKVEAAGVSGVVEQVAVFATVLRTSENKRVFIPNASIVGGNITSEAATQAFEREVEP